MFNVAQTNLQQVRPEIYAKLEEQCAVKLPVQDGEIFSFPALDAMIENNAWVCPIMPEKQVIFLGLLERIFRGYHPKIFLFFIIRIRFFSLFTFLVHIIAVQIFI